MTADAPAAAPGRAPRALVALALLVASGACCWAVLPAYLRLVVRERLLGPQVHEGTVARVRYVRALTFRRVLAPGERPAPGETGGLRQRADEVEELAYRRVEAVTTDGSIPAWPAATAAPGEEAPDRSETYEADVTCPAVREDGPLAWDPRWGQGDPSAWRPGLRVTVRETTKGLRITPAP